MDSQDIQGKAVDALVILNTAIINLRLYPSTNLMIVNTIDRLYDTLVYTFETCDSIVYAEVDKTLLICGEPLNSKLQERPQVAIFLMLLIKWGIKSLEFNKGLDKDELMSLLELLGKKPDEFKPEDLERFMAAAAVTHIRMNRVVYVAKDKDQQIIASANIRDEDIIQLLTSEDPLALTDIDALKDKAKSPEWIAKILQSGLRHFSDQEGSVPPAQLTEGVLQLLRTMDTITDHDDKENIAHMVVGLVSRMDPELVAMLMAKNMDGLLGDHLFDQIIDGMGEEQFESVVEKVQTMRNAAACGAGRRLREQLKHEKNQTSVDQTYDRIMHSEKGMDFQKRKQATQAREQSDKEEHIQQIHCESDALLEELNKDVPDENILRTSSSIVQEAFSVGNLEGAEKLIDSLIDKLKINVDAVRLNITEELTKILDSLSPEQRKEIIEHRLEPLLVWVKKEQNPSPLLNTVCSCLVGLVQERIQTSRFMEAMPMLEAFSILEQQKNTELQILGTDLLRETCAKGIIDILLEGFATDKDGRLNEAGQCLIILQAQSIDPLLDLLETSEDIDKRVTILNVLQEMGTKAAASVAAKIEPNAPWDYLRNLARLLGQIGSSEQARCLVPLLIHEEIRVQKEALKALNNIGGTLRGQILVDVLPKCNDTLKSSIVTILESLKYRDAVQPLLDLFDGVTTLSEDDMADLQVKICIALGQIGDERALPLLNKVSKQKSFFLRRSYPSKVKAAAEQAAAIITGS